ncbi:short-chain dehydrogenase [Corynespora cassiicola Philippines]|uniref:Short-chain dehydrogenase n=1 Tax=Corynespora cassiicola Philippines TaxID=1448308 RepID=A0A2T2NI67_CORCC|nr:short-chain dehydrogenase [Corynespora cassiicola Philippines]
MASKDLAPLKASMGKLFVQSQFCTKPKPPPPTTTLSGQTALVTGSNIGIGLECARQFLDLQVAHLILGVRNIDKGEKAAASLRKAHPNATIEVWPLDMLSYNSVEDFAKRCQGLKTLDVAVLNAGMTSTKFIINQSTGHEEMVQVNYLSTALLAILLLPALSKEADAKIRPGKLTIVSSGTALIAQFPNIKSNPLLPSFDDDKGWDLNAATDRYCTSKTLLLMFVSKISELVDPRKVIINAVDPGFVQGTGLHRSMGAGLRAMFAVLKTLSARSLEQGAWTYIDAAVVRGEESHGCFLMDYDISPYHALMYTDDGKEAVEKLWEETLQEFQFARAEKVVTLVG